MISFYPGPSKVYPQVSEFATEAFRDGIVSLNHRSPAFVQIIKSTVDLIKKKLDIPQNYSVFFISSATEAWEIIAQSFIRTQSIHIYNGAFGEKWYKNTSALFPANSGIVLSSLVFDPESLLDSEKLNFKTSEPNALICVTHNETSNGTTVSSSILRNISLQFPNQFLAIDATSSLGGVDIPFDCVDICFASVQKCLGLPPGLALMICSDRVINFALKNENKGHYNSLFSLYENSLKNQTTHTPNTLGIYLLMRVLESIPPIDVISLKIKDRAKQLYTFFEQNVSSLKLLIHNTESRSPTVIALEGEKAHIQRIKEMAASKGLILGNGYGQWKENTIRIANFPAIQDKEFEILKEFFRSI